jgi:hypothetical protein
MSLSRALTFLMVAISLGCKPQDDAPEQPPAPVELDEAADALARQICAGLFDCTCTGAGYFDSEDDCVDQLSAQYQTSIDDRFAVGGIWDADCAGQLIGTWEDWGCLGPSEALGQATFDPRLCPAIKADLPPGSDCEPSPLGDECSPGSVCVASVCVATQVPVPLGDTCNFDWQQLPCEEGSYCGYDVDGSGEQICKPQPSEGDSCDTIDGYACGLPSFGLLCNVETFVCEPAPGVGEPCALDTYCGAGLYCDGGLDFTCQERFELGHGCGADSVCPVDASCVNGICTADPAAVCSLESFSP